MQWEGKARIYRCSNCHVAVFSPLLPRFQDSGTERSTSTYSNLKESSILSSDRNTKPQAYPFLTQAFLQCLELFKITTVAL
jgi:hypothetical protein